MAPINRQQPQQPQDSHIDPETSETETDDASDDTEDSDYIEDSDPVMRRIWRRYRTRARRAALDAVAHNARIDELNAIALNNGIDPELLFTHITDANQRAFRADDRADDLHPEPPEIYGGFEIPDVQPVMEFQTPPRTFRVVQPPWAPPRPINPRHIINDNADDADDDDEDLPPAPPCLRRLDGQDGFGRPNGPDMGPRGGPGMGPCG
jgi:hypothetical protein